MATTFKTFLNDDVASTRTLLHEAIPVTGSLLFGTYAEPDAADSSTTNIKTFTHGMFQSVYDYTYTKSSANHIFDLTVGYSSSTVLDSTAVAADTHKTKKQMIYNEFAKILQGHNSDGTIRLFDEDGDLTGSGGEKFNECFVISIARLLNKDEIKKGSFYMDLDVSTRLPLSGVCAGDGATSSTGTVVVSGTPTAGETVIFNTTGGVTITATAHASVTSGDDTDNPTFSIDSGIASDIADELAACLGFNSKIISAVNSSGTVTITAEPGYNVNTITENSNNMNATDFTGGTNGNRKELRISDSSSSTTYRVNSPAGDYGILKCDTYKKIALTNDATCTDTSPPTETLTYATDLTSANGLEDLDSTAGLIFYQAGVVVLNPFIFERHNTSLSGYNSAGSLDGRLPGPSATAATSGIVDGIGAQIAMHDATTFTDAMLETESINSCATALRKRINKMAFNNTTELNSTIYFCRAGHNDFNYSSNPTYLKQSQIRVKEQSSDAPLAYITTVGLYSADNELLAVAKLSEPLRKDPTNEMVLRVRLDY